MSLNEYNFLGPSIVGSNAITLLVPFCPFTVSPTTTSSIFLNVPSSILTSLPAIKQLTYPPPPDLVGGARPPPPSPPPPLLGGAG